MVAVAGREFDQEKFEQLILYIARRLGPEAALGRVKLAKLLMLIDFTSGSDVRSLERAMRNGSMVISQASLFGLKRISLPTRL